MKRLKKVFYPFLSTMLCLLLTISFLTSCTTRDQESSKDQVTAEDKTNEQSKADSKEPVTLKIGAPAIPSVLDWNTNRLTLIFEEELGIDLEFVDFPSKEYDTKINLMIASNDTLPDCFIKNSWDVSLVNTWGGTGRLMELNNYIGNLVHIPEAYNDCNMTLENAIKAITKYDGKIYGLPNLSESVANHVSPGFVLLYKPWLDYLKLEIPTSLEELYEILVAFKNKDPNQNGKNDEIPMSGYKDGLFYLMRSLMSPFVYIQDDYWLYDESGKVTVSFIQEEWKEGLKFIKKLIEDGLLDPLLFTQDEASLTALLSQDPETIGAIARLSTSNMATEDTKRYEYVHAHSLSVNKGGKRIANYIPDEVRIGMIISAGSKNVDAAIRLGDLIGGVKYTEINRFGFENEHWIRPPEGEKTVYGVQAILQVTNNIWNQPQNEIWQALGPRTFSAKAAMGLVSSGNTDTNSIQYKSSEERALVVVEAHKFADMSLNLPYLVYNDKEAEIMRNNYTLIETYVEECFTSFVMSQMDIDKDWNEYISTMKSMGLDECIEVAQACLDRMNKK